jgi:SAM-dependent methyltransferase
MDFVCSDINDRARYANDAHNTVCPRCASFPRHRMVCHYLDAHREQGFKNILLFGAERSIENWLRRRGFACCTADLFDRTAELKMDIQDTSFADGSWSLIICNHVLEHVSDYRAALRELWRILSADGILELSVPTDRKLDTVCEDTGDLPVQERISRFGQADHLRIFGRDFTSILDRAGFRVEEIRGDTLPARFRTVVGPADYDDNRIYICRKKGTEHG